MSGQHCENYDVKRETVHCYLRNVDAVAGILARYSKFAFVLFCYITNHLMTGPLGNSKFCFPRISMFPSTSSRETLRFSGNKIHCSPRDQSLSVKYLSLDIICSSKFTVTVDFSEQIMSTDKYPCIFSYQMEALSIIQCMYSKWNIREK